MPGVLHLSSIHLSCLHPSLLPPPCSVLLDPIMGMVSTAIVGSTLGTQALAAVGLCTIVFNFSK